MSLNDLDKFGRLFVQKSIQVIVQSRLGSETRVRTECDPRASDWFNLSIPDDKEVSDRTKKCIESIASASVDKKFSVSKRWQICCEISLKNSDGESLVLEYWLFANEPLLPAAKVTARIASEDLFAVYNRLSLLLKSIVTLTRATPVYRISKSGQGPETFVICYRIFQTDVPIDDLIEERDRLRYSRPVTLGNVSSQCNRIAVTFSYRTNMSTCSDSNRSSASNLMPVKMDHFKPESNQKTEDPESSDLLDFESNNRKTPAFASTKHPCVDTSILVPETAFMSLLSPQPLAPIEKQAHEAQTSKKDEEKRNENIAGDESSSHRSSAQTAGSRFSAASEESFVFIEAPFASPEEKVLGSFFNGPSPCFLENEKLPLQLNELTAEIEAIESSVNQWDSFVESVCSDNSDDFSESVTTTK